MLGSELHATLSDFWGKGFMVGSEVGSDSHATGSSLIGSEGSGVLWGVIVAPRLSGLVSRGVRAVGSESRGLLVGLGVCLVEVC